MDEVYLTLNLEPSAAIIKLYCSHLFCGMNLKKNEKRITSVTKSISNNNFSVPADLFICIKLFPYSPSKEVFIVFNRLILICSGENTDLDYAAFISMLFIRSPCNQIVAK